MGWAVALSLPAVVTEVYRMTQLVQHMICPCCAKQHGREHIPTCPMVYEGSAPGAYELGWREGQSYSWRVVGELAESARDERDQAQALCAMFLLLWAKERKNSRD